MGSGSSKIGGGGGSAAQKPAGGGGANITPMQFKNDVVNAVRSSGNINVAQPAIKQAMSDAAVGTYMEFTQSNGTRNIYEKTSAGTWTMTHYSPSNDFKPWSTQATASDIFNEIWNDNPFLYGNTRG